MDQDQDQSVHPSQTKKKRTKKAQILSLYSNGITDLQDLAEMTDSKSSYVASVLQESGLIHGYFDLYTHSTHPMNVYSKFFSGKLGFKDERTAKDSIRFLESFYQQFESERDRAGQHHALTVALTMYDRARWSGKVIEAVYFKDWLVSKLQGQLPTAQVPQSH